MKVTLKKGFRHLGQQLKEGDEYIGDPAEIVALITQGYADDPGGFNWGWTTQPGQSPLPGPGTPSPTNPS
ncbi:MAG TPA: hypothetical protein VH157_07120 [Bryobacteraceae bacterium]|jgi:hypothetical protein|nr:hypothetical protein [Bryobacteraceae bacterium]